jgi:multidrug efflux system membrane fusion protein
MNSAIQSLSRSFVAGSLLLLAACGDDVKPPPEVRVVRSIVLGGPGAASALTFTAEIHARFETDLAFQVSGKLAARLVDTGARVRRGDALARIDDQDLRTASDAARAAVSAAQAQLERARSDEGRFRDLLERGLTTRSNYLAQQTNTRTAQSQFDQAQSELQLRTQQLGYATLRANRDGVITRTQQDPGAVVSAGQPIVTLAQASELEVVFDVAENQVDMVRAAKQVSVRWLEGDQPPIEAMIREVAPSADPQTRTYRVRASLKTTPPGLKLGMIVTAVTTVDDGSQAALSVPPTALFQHEGAPALWVVGAGSKVELRPVKVSRYDSDRVLIASGVKLGERVVTAGVNRLAVGTQVRVAEQQP